MGRLKYQHNLTLLAVSLILTNVTYGSAAPENINSTSGLKSINIQVSWQDTIPTLCSTIPNGMSLSDAIPKVFAAMKARPSLPAFISRKQWLSSLKPESAVPLLTVTVATDTSSDAFKRFSFSANYYKHDVKVLGQNFSQSNNNNASFQSFQKLFLLRDYLNNNTFAEKQVLLFVDSYDLILLGSPQQIQTVFKTFYPNARILFGGTITAYPRKDLASKFPPTKASPYRYLNAGAIIGYATDLRNLLKDAIIDKECQYSEQIFYSRAFVLTITRKLFNMQIDYEQRLFQYLRLSEPIVKFGYDEAITVGSNPRPYVYNKFFDTYPALIHGVSSYKRSIGVINNYLFETVAAKNRPCTQCSAEVIKEQWNRAASSKPKIAVAVVLSDIAQKPVVLRTLKKLLPRRIVSAYRVVWSHTLPKNFMFGTSHYEITPSTTNSESVVGSHSSNLTLDAALNNLECIILHQAMKKQPCGKEPPAPNNLTQLFPTSDYKNVVAGCVQTNCDYIFIIDATANLTNLDTIPILISQSKPIVAPLLVSEDRNSFDSSTNFSPLESHFAEQQQTDIINQTRIGNWHVACVTSAVLIRRDYAEKLNVVPLQSFYNDKPFELCSDFLDSNEFIHVTNSGTFGNKRRLIK